MYYTVITLPSFSFVPEQFSYKKLKKLGHMEQDKKKHMPWPADLCKGGLEGSISFKTQTKKKKKKKQRIVSPVVQPHPARPNPFQRLPPLRLRLSTPTSPPRNPGTPEHRKPPRGTKLPFPFSPSDMT
jgi:hypothetical protein